MMIECSMGKYSFKIEVPEHLVAITGDSGVGKTFFSNVLRKTAIANNKEDSYSFYDYTTPSKVVIESIEQSNDKTIIIDNADLLSTDINWKQFLKNNKQNTYIIFTRNPSRFGVKFQNIARLKKEYSNNTCLISTIYNKRN